MSKTLYEDASFFSLMKKWEKELGIALKCLIGIAIVIDFCYSIRDYYNVYHLVSNVYFIKMAAKIYVYTYHSSINLVKMLLIGVSIITPLVSFMMNVSDKMINGVRCNILRKEYRNLEKSFFRLLFLYVVFLLGFQGTAIVLAINITFCLLNTILKSLKVTIDSKYAIYMINDIVKEDLDHYLNEDSKFDSTILYDLYNNCSYKGMLMTLEVFCELLNLLKKHKENSSKKVSIVVFTCLQAMSDNNALQDKGEFIKIEAFKQMLFEVKNILEDEILSYGMIASFILHLKDEDEMYIGWSKIQSNISENEIEKLFFLFIIHTNLLHNNEQFCPDHLTFFGKIFEDMDFQINKLQFEIFYKSYVDDLCQTNDFYFTISLYDMYKRILQLNRYNYIKELAVLSYTAKFRRKRLCSEELSYQNNIL